MKLFVYYSMSGSGDCVAEVMKKHGYRVRRINTEKQLTDTKFNRWKLGMAAKMGKKAKLSNFSDNIDQYDEIMFGSPVWGGYLSTPVLAAMDQLDYLINQQGKVVNFMLWSDTGSSCKVTSKLENKYNAQVYELKDPKRNDDELSQLDAIFL